MTFKPNPHSLRHGLAEIIERMPPEQFAQLQDVSDYLGGLADSQNNPAGFVPEGTVADVINRQPPMIRAALVALSHIIENPREMPFTAKQTEAQILDELGLDPQKGTRIKAAVDGLEVAGRLEHRMGGTDLQNGYYNRPPTLRDQIAASASLEEPKARAAAYADASLADAGKGIPMRRAIESIGDTKAQQIGESYQPEPADFTSEPGSIRDDIECAIVAHELTAGNDDDH